MSGPGALLWGLIYLLLTPKELCALLAAVLSHELGHILALLLLDGGVDALCLTGTGLRIDCRRKLPPLGEMLAALAGPIFGLLWCLCAKAIGCELSFRISVALTVFNLLPMSYLDGGRAIHSAVGIIFGCLVAEKISAMVDGLFCLIVCCLGLISAYRGGGVMPAAAGAWLTAVTFLNKKAPPH